MMKVIPFLFASVRIAHITFSSYSEMRNLTSFLNVPLPFSDIFRHVFEMHIRVSDDDLLYESHKIQFRQIHVDMQIMNRQRHFSKQYLKSERNLTELYEI